MESITVTGQDFTDRKGNRYPVTKPQDSNILRGDGSFTAETQNALEYSAKTGERYDAVRPGESDIWKASISVSVL